MREMRRTRLSITTTCPGAIITIRTKVPPTAAMDLLPKNSKEFTELAIVAAARRKSATEVSHLVPPAHQRTRLALWNLA